MSSYKFPLHTSFSVQSLSSTPIPIGFSTTPERMSESFVHFMHLSLLIENTNPLERLSPHLLFFLLALWWIKQWVMICKPRENDHRDTLLVSGGHADNLTLFLWPLLTYQLCKTLRTDRFTLATSSFICYIRQQQQQLLSQPCRWLILPLILHAGWKSRWLRELRTA